ncbi:MAG: tRNA (N(6)-L-threonylcarbamoyladenosine(37)-C(2))-methylthiotransferase MtaB [Planctomycetes bacterium]|nr:tRNA (N(6)-L-threonylcarbamoyladenosine(37)-C(2))-methylthiotransferase MtaB [Planctomycetota bacterium]
MKTFAINTLGCKVNQYESQQIRQQLEKLGLQSIAAAGQRADLFIINTCCVTHTASAKSRQYIRKARRLNPKAAIVICGCLARAEVGELDCEGENIYVVDDFANLAFKLDKIINSAKKEDDLELDCEKFGSLEFFAGQTRAFLKVQDGCDGYCSYCIIPTTRPVINSRSQEEILQEAAVLVKNGHKEIVVTGIYLGAYSQKTVKRKNWPEQRNEKLAELIDKMAQIPNLERLRLSSLEPGDITPELLDVFCRNSNIMPHLHLSLQSGSDNILKKMNRQYDSSEFREKIKLIKSQLDRPAITTDIIVGFPGETDSDFVDSINLAKEVGFAKIHVFSFSPRKGTAAAIMKDRVNSVIIKKRSRILRDLDAELAWKFRKQFLGQTDMVLVENNSCGKCVGRASRYFEVEIETNGKSFKPNDLLEVELIRNESGKMLGRIS